MAPKSLGNFLFFSSNEGLCVSVERAESSVPSLAVAAGRVATISVLLTVADVLTLGSSGATG
jgi:hypothetical protein